MRMSDSPEKKAGAKAERHFLWRKPRTRWLLGIPIGGFLLLVVGLGLSSGFATALHFSNTLEFCTSCHEMSDKILPGYKESPHYKNVASMNELPAWAMGTVNTKEKFAAVQVKLAEHVWAKMKATDSRQCKNCQSIEAMDLSEQDSSAAKKHIKERMLARGETCIDCHKGIGHGLPPGYEE